ncbi:hypothetical protein ABZT47_00805 [Sphaerisporangium sp. NPDC005289]|uniref:hypothetical protein n=1 Tax=Sphaerisporangium sp. NPDC005289 TaxID=3155247 RepID=UPI0033BEF125
MDDEDEFTTVLESFMFTKRLKSGRTVVESFAERFSGEKRALLLSWTDYVVGVFESKEWHGDDGFVAVNHVDELTYLIRSNMGPKGIKPFIPGSVMVGGILPIGDEWMLSGTSTLFSPVDAPAALEAVRDFQMANPKMVFRNPGKLARAREMQARQRDSFIDLFGGDLIVVPSDKVEERMLALYRHDYERAGSQGGPWTDPGLPSFGFDADDVLGVIYDEEDGLGMYRDFDVAQEVFADPALIIRRRYREVIKAYLRGDDVTPVPLRRLAAQDPAKTDQLFRKLLKKPDFLCERDGEALLREHKPGWFASPPLPTIIPV